MIARDAAKDAVVQAAREYLSVKRGFNENAKAVFDKRAALRESLAALDAAPAGDGWRTRASHPSAPIQVELFLGDAPLSFVCEPHRDQRRQIGYWDGEKFCDCGTGHDIRDRFDPYMPTHWRALPPAPSEGGDHD